MTFGYKVSSWLSLMFLMFLLNHVRYLFCEFLLIDVFLTAE